MFKYLLGGAPPWARAAPGRYLARCNATRGVTVWAAGPTNGVKKAQAGVQNQQCTVRAARQARQIEKVKKVTQQILSETSFPKFVPAVAVRCADSMTRQGPVKCWVLHAAP